MSKLNDLISERAKILTQATELAAKVKAESDRDLIAEERLTIDKLAERAGELDTEITSLRDAEHVRAADMKRRETLDRLARESARPDNRRSAPPEGRAQPTFKRIEDTEEYGDLFSARMRCDMRAAVQAEIALERRAGALSQGTNASGGYLLLPTALADALVQVIDELSGVAAKFTKINVGDAKSIGIPKVTARGDDADWTTEIASVNADTNLTTGRRDLMPTMLTKEVLASISFVQRSPQAQPFVMRQLARLFAVTKEKAALSGTGSSQPLGLFVPSANGISTGRDKTASSTTTFTYNDLVGVKYNVRQNYMKAAEWLIHRDFMKIALQLQDGEGRPIFQPAWTVGGVDTLLGNPVNYSEFAPNTFTTAQYVAVFGDMSNFWWADAMTYAVQIADQIAARSNQISFIGRMEADGSPALEEAFSRLILG